MARVLRVLAQGMAIAIATSSLLGCGTGDEVVRFDSPNASISRATLDHWMRAIAGGDLRRNLGAEGPSGLVSEPPDYQRCFVAAKLVGLRSFFNQLRFDRAQITRICRELHQAIESRALSFLIFSHWVTVESAKHHVTADPSEVQEMLGRLTGLVNPSQASLRRYLAERQWSLSDLLFQAKLDVLAGKIDAHRRPVADTVGSYVALSPADRKDLVARTHCRAGYFAPGCRGYAASGNGPSPEAILVQLTGNPER